MTIEWAGMGSTSMTVEVLDNTTAPATVLRADQPFDIRVSWDVPPGIASIVGAGHSFRLRAYAESIGPGQEIQIGPTVSVPAVNGQLTYPAHPAPPPYHTINVPAGTLKGEGELVGTDPVSGTYKVLTVLQLMVGTSETGHSGFVEGPVIQMRSP